MPCWHDATLPDALPAGSSVVLFDGMYGGSITNVTLKSGGENMLTATIQDAFGGLTAPYICTTQFQVKALGDAVPHIVGPGLACTRQHPYDLIH